MLITGIQTDGSLGIVYSDCFMNRIIAMATIVCLYGASVNGWPHKTKHLATEFVQDVQQKLSSQNVIEFYNTLNFGSRTNFCVIHDDNV